MHRKSLRPILAAVMAASLFAAPVSADPPPPTAVAHWNAIATTAFAQPPQVQVLHLAMVQGAVYDAVNAIVGGRQAFNVGVDAAPATASQDAAVATAAHGVLVGMTPPPPGTSVAALSAAYAAFMAGIPDGSDKDAGVAAGADAAAAMLAARAGDGRFASGVAFPVGFGVSQWRPLASGNDPFAWVAGVRPFVIQSADQFASDGPLDVASAAYAEEYNEVKVLGAASGSSRSQPQTDLAIFYTVNPVEMFNRTFRSIAADQGLSTADEARLFAQLNVAGADALISCWADKARTTFWRPLTAIHEGENDGNPATAGDPTWQSLRGAPAYPEHPSGYNCLTGAMMAAARDVFGTDRVAFTMSATTNPPSQPRPYIRFTDVLKDTIDARIYLGFHFRTAEMQGAVMGKQIAHWVNRHAFRPTD